ncbi:plasmid maintenance system killer [Desulfovibrio sp. X2]|uniref:type II toxin-antitoxin system RelE/ParE family toxin n=1 Tax=Desulfovibrio sp. X2 TaxID=941449 RepID=UPI000358EA36|nr:type II toxin-antitoxin system RelE/ParE family toxin [Desulfovibrio sp. X2]EPR42154.1 plasmid maintenance system killer [Desulfovibrio sp. X2]
MIRSFACKETERVFYQMRSRRFGADVLRAIQRKLAMLDAAVTLDDLRSPPGNRLEPLSGDRSGQWSIRVNGQFRVCFTWTGRDAENVEVVDYH